MIIEDSPEPVNQVKVTNLLYKNWQTFTRKNVSKRVFRKWQFLQPGKQIEKPRVTVGKTGKFCRDVEYFPGISGCVPCRVRETFGLRTLLCARTARNFEGSDRNGKTDEKRFLKRCFTDQVDRQTFPQKKSDPFRHLADYEPVTEIIWHETQRARREEAAAPSSSGSPSEPSSQCH